MSSSSRTPSPLVDQVKSADRRSLVELAAADLNDQGGVFCPSPKADMKIWNTHPKVYLDVARTGEAKCPYCGTVYRLKAGETVGHRH
ncbi:MAG: zinc-finger domain-containing protein [Variovorax sp.]|nr:MAG: zinc-finger domain-containing protein [Variovorax sp.]